MCFFINCVLFIFKFEKAKSPLNAITRNRILLEKRYFLNNSNTKWVSVGVKPDSKLLSVDSRGFYVEVLICGVKMSPMSLGGHDGFLNLCQSLRTLDEFKFAYPVSGDNYDDIDEIKLPLNINRQPIGGSICFNIENINGENALLALSTLMELLKYENLIVAAARKMATMTDDLEKKFNEFAVRASTDMKTLLEECEKSGDLLMIEIFTNFNEVFKTCIESVAQHQANTAAVQSVASGRKRSTKSNGDPKSKTPRKASASTVVTPVTTNNATASGSVEVENQTKPAENMSTNDHTYTLQGDDDSNEE